MRLYVRLLLVLLPLPFACPARCQSPDPTVIAADAAYAAKQYADAIPLYQQVVASGLPDDVRARAQFQVGWSYYILENRKQAQVEWISVADLFPKQTAYACNALLRAGNSAVGVKDFAAAAPSYQRAADTYTGATEAREYAMQARCWLGNVRLRMAELTKQRESAYREGDSRTAADIWKLAAVDYHAAEEAYRALLKDFPEAGKLRAEAEMLLVSLDLEYALYHQGKTLKDVKSEADQFLARWQDDPVRRPTVFMMRAEALFYMQDYDAAISDISEIQTRYPTTAKESLGTSQFFLARCYEDKHDWERALTEYNNYLVLSIPSFNERILHSQARFFAGHCLRGMGKLEEALAAYQKTMDEYADCPISHSARIYRDDLARSIEPEPPVPPTSSTMEGPAR